MDNILLNAIPGMFCP